MGVYARHKKSIVKSHREFSNQVWQLDAQKQKRALGNTQKRATLLIQSLVNLKLRFYRL